MIHKLKVKVREEEEEVERHAIYYAIIYDRIELVKAEKEELNTSTEYKYRIHLFLLFCAKSGRIRVKYQ